MKKILLCICLLSVFHLFGQDSLGSAKGAPQVATIGVFVVNIFELDMSSNSYYADFYLWCRWRGDIDPLKNMEFSNSKEQWGFSKTNLHDSSILLKDGYCYNSIHVQGKFNHNFILNNYPFDQQNIAVHVENSIYTTDQLIYRPDTVNSHIEEQIRIPGWNIGKFSFSNTEHKYKTNFGLPENKDNDSYSNLSFSLTLSRPIQYFFWKLLLPIIIVLLSGFGSTIIHPRYVDARIYAPVGALLTTVFLQQSYSAQLPDISYLVLTDKIYVIVYLTIISGVFHAIYTANILREGNEESFARARLLDRKYVIIVGILLVVAAAFLCIF